MTVLTRLKTMSDPEIRNWLRKVGRENVITLEKALLGADDAVKNCVFRNMSVRAISQLKEDLNKYNKMNIGEEVIKKSCVLLEKLM